MVGDCDWYFVYSEDIVSFGYSMGSFIKFQKFYIGFQNVIVKFVRGRFVNYFRDFVIFQSNLLIIVV